MLGYSLISDFFVGFPSGSKDHVKVQGEILEGLVARIVSRDSSVHMEKALKDFPPPPLDGSKLLKSACCLIWTLVFILCSLIPK